MNQSRRSFLGLISAVSAAVAAGVRVPASTEAAAAGTAPAVQPMSDDEAEVLELPPQTEAANKLERDLRKLLEQYVVVETEGMQCFGGPTHWRVVYRRSSGRPSPLDAQKPNWAHLRPTAIKLTSPAPRPYWIAGQMCYEKPDPFDSTVEVTWA